ncbi:INO80, partial [Symbiodinium microadriaticum]
MEGLPRQRPPIPCGPSLQFCVDRTLAMLQMGHNAFVVDKTTYVDNDGNPQPHSWHRAKIVSLITRSCLGEASVDGVSVVSKFKGRGKKIGQTSRWGPILVVVKAKELFKWEEVFRDEFKLPVAAENGVGSHARLMTYCGSDADRTLLRSYLTSSSLYTQRSHCHIVLTHYEALATDLVHLKTVHWQLMVLDSAWSIMSHSTYKHFMHELLGMTCRHRILSCPQLGFYKATADKTAEGPKLVSLLRTYFPDPLAALRFVFPSMWDFMEHFLGNEDASDGLTHRLIAHVLSAGYVVRPTQSNESAPENGVSRFYLLFDIDYTIQTTMSYADEDMARELKGVKMESIGKAANSQRRRSRNRSKPAGTVLSVPSGEDGDMKERKRPGRKPGWAAAAAAAASAAKMKEELDRLEVLEGEEDGNDEGVQERVEDGEVGGEDKSDDEEDEEGEDGDGENNDMEVVADEEDDPVEPAPDSSQSGFLDSVLRIVVGGGGGHQKDGDEEGDDEDKGGGEALASQAMVSDVDLEELGGQDGDDSVSAPSKLEGGRGGRGTVGASQYPKPISIKKYDEEDEKK